MGEAVGVTQMNTRGREISKGWLWQVGPKKCFQQCRLVILCVFFWVQSSHCLPLSLVSLADTEWPSCVLWAPGLEACVTLYRGPSTRQFRCIITIVRGELWFQMRRPRPKERKWSIPETAQLLWCFCTSFLGRGGFFHVCKLGRLCYLYPRPKLSEVTEGPCFPTRTAFRREDRELFSLLGRLSPIPLPSILTRGF